MTTAQYIKGVPHNGHLTHAVRDQPASRERMGIGNMRLRSRALCGVRGVDANLGGGFRVVPNHEAPAAFDPDSPDACRRCVRRYCDLQSHPSAAAPALTTNGSPR